MDNSIFCIILFVLQAVAAISALCMTFREDLLMLQQNSYRNDRYFRWWKKSLDFANPLRLAAIVGLALLILLPLSPVTDVALIIIFAVQTAVLARRKHKKPLVFTKRVWRLFITMSFLSIMFVAGACLGGGSTTYALLFGLLVLDTFSWIVLSFSNFIMKPVEASINQMYRNDARLILNQMPDLKVIGITGSYGKTSTKHYLYRILCEQFDVLMTPGSYNTTMGVIRTIREMLKPYNEVFIVEMGAKQPGDIRDICNLVHPHIGIITAVGEQHLESFKTIENVQRTKFELVEALPADGFAVLNNDFPYVASRPVENVKAFRYAVNATRDTDYTASNIVYSSHGTSFTINGGGKSLALSTKLVGECNISNLMAAVIVAMQLGIDDEKIKYAVSRIEQVEHRLNMTRTPGGITIIDDAFNSNPDGSRMALDVLSQMIEGRRIVVTPGMIELGDKQDYYNNLFGQHIAETCDIALVVGQYNRQAIVDGIKKTGKFNPANLYTPATFAEAQQILAGIMKKGDTVLYENDLPDTFK